MIFILCLLSNVAKTQTCQYNPDYQHKLLSFDNPSLMMKEFQGLGYGYWFKYQPYIKIGEGQQFGKTINSERKLLSAEFYNGTDLTIYHYAQFEMDQNHIIEINHYVELYTMEKYTIIKHTFNSLNYEGKWGFFAIQFDIKVQVIFFSDSLDIYDVIDQVRRTVNMNYYLGYYGSIFNQFNQTFLSFSQFKGVLSNIFTLTEMITETNIHSIIDSGCDQISQCNDKVQLPIFLQKIFYGDSYYSYNLLNYRDQVKYSISMWVKQHVERQIMFQKQVFLRISLTQNYTDLDITDKELYLEYQQSLNDQENGIIISTYSFDAPIYGNGDMNLNQISILDSNLINGFKYWHFIQYDFGNTQGTFNNKFTLIIPSIAYEQIQDFGKDLNHFTGSALYFYIGGGILKSEKQFNGQINNFNFYYCQSDDLQLMNQCYYHCDTCNGPTQNDCLTCPAGSNRILWESQCVCSNGFIEQQIQNQVCQLIVEVYPIVNIIEIPYVCELQGYDQCQDEIICGYGYFKFLNKCYQWYYFFIILSPELQNDQINILCTDCLFNSNWNFICQDDLLSQQEDYVLTQNRRKYPQIYYMLNYNDEYGLLQCQGCKQYQISQNQLIILECQESFYLSQNFCLSCENNCISCTQTQCLICESGYVFNKIENKCIKCEKCQECAITQTNQIICLSCPNKYYLTILNQCQQCGINCEVCNQSQCLTCAKNTFISIDGQSCQSCDIDNCEICFFQYLKTNTLDFQFQQLPLEIQYQTQCAKCLDNYYLSNNNCLSKSQLTNIPVIQFDGCVTGVIESPDTLVCLVGSTSTAIEINNCQSLVTNCKNCIKNYNGINKCIICIDGYYVNLKQNECLECPINCYQCLQQSKVFQDGWKYKIRAFYEYFINSQKDHYFEQFGMDQNQQNYQIVCISCNPGQVLYDGGCIQDCSSSCLKCEIIDGHSQCLQCKPNEFGYLRSIDNQLQCINCPFKCKACIQRDQSGVKQINNLYTKLDGFSNQCIQQFDDNFIDNGLGLIIECKSSQKCYNKLLIILNVYCDHDEFITQQNLQTDILFLQGSLYVDDIQDYIDNIFTQDLYTYLNQQVIKEAEIQIQLLQGQQYCQLNNLNINNKLKQNVFALQDIQISFIGDPFTNIQINGQVNLTNFTDIVFENINFITNQIQPQINLNSQKFINLKFINSQIVQSQDLGLLVPQFNIQNPQLVKFNSFSIIGTQIQNSKSLFNFQYSQVTNTIIQITDFIIQDSLISNTQFFSLQNNPNLSQITIIFVNLQFINSQFSDNFIFYTQQKQIQDIGIIDINQITLINSQFSNSSIISAECIKQSTIQGIQSQMLVLQNSTLFRQNTMIVSNALFEFSIIMFSTLFSNFATQINLINQNIIMLTQIAFSDTQYVGSNSFINIVQQTNQNIMLTLDTITLLNNHLPEISPMFTQIRDVSYRQSSIYISCNSAQLINIFIDRAPGYSEISLINTIIILIQNFTVSTNDLYRFKLIQSDISCFQMTSFLDFYFVLYIFDFQNLQIIDITINNTYVVDYSIIIIESASQIERQQQESIAITNGQFNFNRLAIINSDRESAIIKIKSQQQQTIIFNNLYVSENILKLYIQDNLKTSATTFLIQSDFGLSQMDNLTFQQNYIINSISSPLVLYVESISISHTNFYNNSVFDFAVWKSSFSWGYLGDVFHEQIYLQDQRIMPNGGSAQIFAQIISINDVNVNGSFGLSGGAFYLKTKGIGDVKITNTNFSYSKIDGQTRISFGGTIILFSENSFLTFFMDNVNIYYVFSRYYGGFMMLQPSAASITTIVLQNIQCINCFSIYGGFFSNISPFGTSFGISICNITNVTLSNYDIPWWSQNLMFNTMALSDYQDLQTQTNFIWVFMVHLNMQHIKMYNSSIFSALAILQAISVVLNDVDIQDTKPFFSPMISIDEVQEQINITNFRFSKLDQINFTNSSLSQCNQSMTFIMMQQFQVCMPDVYTEDQYNSSSYMTKEFISNQYECFQLNTYFFGGISFSGLIFIVTVYDLLYIQNVTVTDVKFHFNNWGMIGIINNLALPNSVQISNLVIEGCSCDYLGCLLITQSTGFLSYNPGQRRILTDNEQSNFQSLSSSQLNVTATVQDSKFINNNGKKGTGIGSYGLNLLVKNCIFLNNHAEQVGAAIYFAFEPFSLILIDTIIMNNTSGWKQGEGIYLETKSFSKISSFNDVVQFNGDQDVYEWPYSISMILNNKTQQKTTYQNDSQILIEMIQVQPFNILGYSEQAKYITFPAGQQLDQYKYFDPFEQKFIPYNLSLRIIPMNRYNQRIYNLTKGDQISFTARIIDEAREGQFTTNQFTQAFVYYSNVTQDFNLDNLTLYFASNSSSYIEIKFICSSLKIPTYEEKFPYNQNGTKSYELRVKVKTFPCQLGEYFDFTNQSCTLCTGRSYSVSYNVTKCSLKDDTKIVATNQALIQLQFGYWRAYYNSPIIDQCYHQLQNCPGGWSVGNGLCINGHIGALCEQCDLYNIRGNGSYYVNQIYSCNTCQSVSQNIMTIILISIWALLSIFITVYSTLVVLKEFILRQKLRILGYIIVDPTPAPAVLIKVLTNYLQIIFTISTFQLEIPSDLTMSFNSIGNPVQVMSYSLDCFIVNMTNINIMYFRIIWSIIMCLIYVALFFSCYVFLMLMKKASYTITVITTCLIYIYLYLSPNFIGSLISLISYRYISGEYWIQGNISYRYDTKTHFKWLLGFAFPSLFVIALIIPIFLWYCVHTNKNLLQETKTKKIWGYLYNEYRKDTYYWETIKIILKEFIIIVLAYYEDYIPIKAALIFLSLFFYSFLTNYQKPYNTGLFNRLDSHQTVVCAVSIILATTIHSAQQYQLKEIIWPFYILIGVLNGLFFLKILYYLIQAYTSKLENQIDSIKEALFAKCPNLFFYHPTLREFLESNTQRKKRVKQRFNKIKQYLMPQARLISTFKKNNNIELPQSNQTIKLTNLGKMSSIKGVSSQELIYNNLILQEPIITSPKYETERNQQPPLYLFNVYYFFYFFSFDAINEQ